MSEEIDEFNSIAVAETNKTLRSPTPYDDDDPSHWAGPVRNNPGKLVQYGFAGPGMLPQASTVSSLEPGVYRIEGTDAGNIFVKQAVFTDNLMRLPDSKSDEVIAMIERFWTKEMKERFKRYGLLHKRGVLLWGPPGSGKTTTVSQIIKQIIDLGGVVLLGNEKPAVISGMMKKFREIEPNRPLIVVFEDIDAIIASYGESETLATLDGESSINNVVFLATTNYPEKLDGRVVNRPSRFDRVVKIGMPNEAARRAYLLSRNIPAVNENIDKWVESTKNMSIAHMKELIISVCCYDLDFDDSLKLIKGMEKKPKSDSEDRKVGFGSSDSDVDDDD